MITNLLSTDDSNGNRYKLTGEYDSEKNNMEYSFRSPADKVNVVYISIGSKKSTVTLNEMNSGHPIYSVITQIQQDLDYNRDMGKNGNGFTSAGCEHCQNPGTGAEITNNLIRGDGICSNCHGSGRTVFYYSYEEQRWVYHDCKDCHGSGRCHACMGVGSYPHLYAKN